MPKSTAVLCEGECVEVANRILHAHIYNDMGEAVSTAFSREAAADELLLLIDEGEITVSAEEEGALCRIIESWRQLPERTNGLDRLYNTIHCLMRELSVAATDLRTSKIRSLYLFLDKEENSFQVVVGPLTLREPL